MATAREELHQLAESLPDAAAEELAAIGKVLAQQARSGAIEEVTDPEEVAIVQDAWYDDGAVLELSPEQVKATLAARRQGRRP